jgi:hypothetical protein
LVKLDFETLDFETPAERIERDKTCLGDEGEDATKIPIRNHSFKPPVNFTGASPQGVAFRLCSALGVN